MFDQIKKLWTPFIIFFAIAFMAINWNSISWIFNYKAVLRYASDFAEKKQEQSQSVVATTSDNKVLAHEDGIEIPKIEISAPLVVNKDLSDEGVHKALDTGVVYYPSSALPGETGQTIILGHSAPAGWPKIKYDWVFSNISKLTEGDEIEVYYQGKKNTYSVTKTIFLDRGEEVPAVSLAGSKNVLILISCWPPGKDYKRIAVEAVIK
jgi:LPXTG-site transpeptidase (sortase) family protein